MKKSVFLRAAAFIICLIECFLFCIGAGAKGAFTDGGKCRLFLTAFEGKDDEFEVTLNLSSLEGVCAVLAEISYDSELFSFLSCGAEEASFNIIYKELDGRVVFLLDSLSNSGAECILARFCFKRLSDKGGELLLTEELGSRVLAYDELGDASYIKAVGAGCRIEGRKQGSGQDGKDKASPSVDEISFERLEGGELRLCYKMVGVKGAFAAGVRLFVLDIERRECFELYLTALCGGRDEIEKSALIGECGRAAVIVTAVEYGARDEILGEKTVHYIE